MAPTSPDGVDLDRLRPFFAEHVAGADDAPLTATLIAGGRSNLTYSITDGTTTGCCAGRRSATCCPPRTTWAASTA